MLLARFAESNPGDLRHLVEIGCTENTVNEMVSSRMTSWSAGHGPAWWTRATNYRAADVMNTEAVINFTIRYRADVKPGMWVRFQGEKWDISTLGEYALQAHISGLKASLRGRADEAGAEALKNIGIPVMAGVWRATSANQNPPAVRRVLHHHHGSRPSGRPGDGLPPVMCLQSLERYRPHRHRRPHPRRHVRRGLFMVEESDQGDTTSRLRHRYHAVYRAVDVAQQTVKRRRPLKRRALTALPPIHRRTGHGRGGAGAPSPPHPGSRRPASTSR